MLDMTVMGWLGPKTSTIIIQVYSDIYVRIFLGGHTSVSQYPLDERGGSGGGGGAFVNFGHI